MARRTRGDEARETEAECMKLEIEIPSKYERKLADIEEVEPTIRDQIEVEVLPQVLRLINDAHRQLEQQQDDRLVGETEE